MQAIERRPPPLEHLHVRLPGHQVEELDRLARATDCFRSEVARHALRLGLDALTTTDDDQENPT